MLSSLFQVQRREGSAVMFLLQHHLYILTSRLFLRVTSKTQEPFSLDSLNQFKHIFRRISKDDVIIA